MLLCFSPLISEHFWPASTLLHGNSLSISGFRNRLRYHVRFQVYGCTCFLKARLTQGLSLSCCRLSSRGSYFGPPTAFLRRGTGVPWVSLPGPTSVPHSPGWLSGKAPTHFVLVGVCSWRCRRVRSRVRVSPLICIWEYLHPCGLWVLSPMKLLIDTFFISFKISSHLSCLLLAMSQSTLFT